VLTETRRRTVDGTQVTEVTRHVYDARNRVIQTADPLGNVTRTEYDLIGEEPARIDALGRCTRYVRRHPVLRPVVSPSSPIRSATSPVRTSMPRAWSARISPHEYEQQYEQLTVSVFNG
jgi:YD repeat-containing protein